MQGSACRRCTDMAAVGKPVQRRCVTAFRQQGYALVERLIRGPLPGGIQEHAWSGAPASLRSGAYFLRLTTPAGSSVAPLLVVR